MKVAELPTPSVVIDLAKMHRNIESMAAYVKQHELGLRPHTKTHKTPQIGQMQLDAGALGLTVAKIGEAEIMGKVDPENLLIAYPMVGRERVQRLVELARKVSVTVALDDESVARPISEAASSAGVSVGILVEQDVGARRMGLQTSEEVVSLAETIERMHGLEFKGLQTYCSHVHGSEQEIAAGMAQIEAKQRETLEGLAKSGISCGIVSGGTTPSSRYSHLAPSYTEIRPGTYIFCDRNCINAGFATADDCALTVHVTVISTAVPGQVILDAGGKSLAMDALSFGGMGGHGLILEAPQAAIQKMNEEHAFVDVRECDRSFKVGDRLRVIPNHVCACVNMHNRTHGADGDEVVAEWTVAGRGLVV
jgi:D-serine deaminase-like pyridoxal phosphate-dependent protein